MKSLLCMLADLLHPVWTGPCSIFWKGLATPECQNYFTLEVVVTGMSRSAHTIASSLSTSGKQVAINSGIVGRTSPCHSGSLYSLNHLFASQTCKALPSRELRKCWHTHWIGLANVGLSFRASRMSPDGCT